MSSDMWPEAAANPPAPQDSVDEQIELCGRHVYWWNGEYDSNCELLKDHLEPFHYDGVSYFDDDNNNRDDEQKNLEKLIDAAIRSALVELDGGLPEKKTPDSPNWIYDDILLGDKEERIAHNAVIDQVHTLIQARIGGEL